MRFFAIIALACAALSATADAAQDRAVAHGVEARRGAMVMRVEALTDQVLRVRIGREGVLPEDASWAVDARTRVPAAAIAATADGFTTAALAVHLDPATLRLTVTDRAGKVIVADAAEPVALDGRGFTLRKAMPLAEHYVGLGDKTGGMDRRGGSFVDWNTDAFGFSSATDPIYKSIPFFIGVGGAGGTWGLFLDNTWRTWFDFGRREADTIAIGANDGPIDYYLIVGPTTADVVHRYTDLTGRAPLPPRWALGYQQSRYSYASAAELRAVADRLRAERVPTDVLWLDIGYLDRNTPFTVDKATFPDLPGLIRDEGAKGFRIVTITDLHVAANRPAGSYPPYDSGRAIDAFVHRADGSVYIAPVWPGPSAFPDFTLPRVRDWWGGLFRDQVAMGVAGSWNDMNEPAIFDTPTKTMPLDNLHRIAGDGFAPRTATHAEIHNVYGMENTRATVDGLKRFAADERPFVMTRASYAGGQRYAVTWTGDNSATWDHLKLSVQQIANLGLSGFAWSGADVSGFAGGPSPDLLTRWFEIGAFYPIFRDHSAAGTPRVEPWVDGPEHLAIRRRFVEERYRLMPYLYALADQNARAGDPVLRPVFYDYPDALRLPCDQSWVFTLGKALLIAPPTNPESPQPYDICLPAGNWYAYWTGKRLATPPLAVRSPIQSASQATGEAQAPTTKLTVVPQLDTLAVFVRAGTILPRQAVVQSTAETPAGPLRLDVYPGPDCAGDLYDDDGHSLGFERGDYLRQHLRCAVTASGVSVDFGPREGRHRPWWRRMTLVVHGWRDDAVARLNGKPVARAIDGTGDTVSIDLPDQPRAASVTVERR